MLLALGGEAHASPIEFYGFGGRELGRASAGMVLPEGAGSVLSNAAALPGSRYARLSVGFLGVAEEFADIPDVWWDTNRDGLVNTNDTALDVGPDYDPVQGFLIGATLPAGKTLCFGVAMFFPVQRILRLETFEPSIPTYFLYANRSQRYEIGAALGWRPIAGLAIGGGVQMIPRAAYSLDATLEATVSGADEGDTEAGDVVGATLDVHTMALDLVWGFSPNVDLHWDVGQAIPALDGLLLGAQWRGEAGLPVDVDLDLQINAGTKGLGDTEDAVVPLILALNLGVFDHYLPERLSFGGAYTIAHTLTLSADVRRTAWDKMRVNIAEVTDVSIDGAAIHLDNEDVTDGNPYDLELRPTWGGRVGADLYLPPFKLSDRLGKLQLGVRGGLGYEPTPLVSQTAATALLDADRIIFAVGLGVEGDDPFRKPENRRAVRLDGFFQYHVLASGELDRGSPSEPTAGYAVDGSAIPIGGHLLAAGAEWSVEY